MTGEECALPPGGSCDGMIALPASLAAEKRKKHSMVYLKGLMSDQERKSVEPIALQFARGRNGERAAQKEVVALQEFI